jgi:hypothetical protein
VGGGGELLAERVEAGGLLGLGGALADDEGLAAAALEDAVALEEAEALLIVIGLRAMTAESARVRELGAGREQAVAIWSLIWSYLPVGGDAVVEIDGEQGRHSDFSISDCGFAIGRRRIAECKM